MDTGVGCPWRDLKPEGPWVSVSIYTHIKKDTLTPGCLLPSWAGLPSPTTSVTLPIRLLVVNWPQAGPCSKGPRHALLGRSLPCVQRILARFQDGFKPAGPFWSLPFSSPGLGVLRAKLDPWAPSPISESLATSPSLPLQKPLPTGFVWIAPA